MAAKHLAFGAGLALAAFLSPPVLEAQETKPAAPATAAYQTRMRWQDFVSGPDGARRLASLKTAIDKMKKLDSSPKDSADYRRSWEYWANIHGYYGTQSPDGTLEEQIAYLKANNMSQYVPYYQGMTDQTPPDTIAKTVWATCQHSGSTMDQQAQNFFGWHRMLLYYYERVLRWASGDDTLRLPYWDYTDPAQLALPDPFRTTSAVLYDQRRDPGMNAGTSTLSSVRTNINDYLKLSDYLTYEFRIERTVHGYVHCTVGPTCPVAHMGDVPVAGNDPVFYSHHANIDRMWACWQNLYPFPEGAWWDQKFSFPDETGAMVTRPVRDFLDSKALGYVYDNTTDCSRPATSARLAASEGKKPFMIAAAKGLAVDQPKKSFALAIPKAQLKSSLAESGEGGTVELTLDGVTAASHPGVQFDVFLARKGDAKTRQYVGTLSFFGAFRGRGHAGHGGQGGAKAGPEKHTFVFDVTDELRALGGEADLTLELEATTGRETSDPAQAEAERKRGSEMFRSAARLQIGSISLGTPAAKPKA